MTEKIPLVIEGRLLDCGDGCECGWVTLGGIEISDLLPDVERLDTECQCATIETGRADDPPYHRQIGDIVVHPGPLWELPHVRGQRYDYVFRDWGNVRVTIEWLDGG